MGRVAWHRLRLVPQRLGVADSLTRSRRQSSCRVIAQFYRIPGGLDDSSNYESCGQAFVVYSIVNGARTRPPSGSTPACSLCSEAGRWWLELPGGRRGQWDHMVINSWTTPPIRNRSPRRTHTTFFWSRRRSFGTRPHPCNELHYLRHCLMQASKMPPAR